MKWQDILPVRTDTREAMRALCKSFGHLDYVPRLIRGTTALFCPRCNARVA